jgi:MarR family transcriptional regulator, 2-MHQ and catechol-resistance regulon repressor
MSSSATELDALLHAGGDRITAYGMLLEAQAALASVVSDELERTSGLPHAWLEVLVRLSRSPERRLRMSELAGQVLFSTSGLTRLIDRMETAGLVGREACPNDRRGAFAVITPAGEDALRHALPRHLESLDRHLLHPIGEDDLAVMTEILERLRDAARRSTATHEVP